MYALAGSKPIVQKYGGTSVGTTDRILNVARRVRLQIEAGFPRIAIVVSAMSGETNRLVELVRQVNPNAPALAYDMAVAAGEQVAVALMAAALESEGVAARPFLAHQLGILTDTFHSRARIQRIDTQKLHRAWEQHQIPVIAGFQGVTEEMEITTLGRGGSDTSAVALAVAVGAAFCEINTDVDGVFTADPRYVKGARLCPVMDFEVALEMASLGSKVLHPRCVELGAKWGMPIVVRNTFSTNEHQRTKIMNFGDSEQLEATVVSGITVDRNVTRITVDGLARSSHIIAAIFQRVAGLGVNVDIIVHDQAPDGENTRLGFTVGKDDTDKALRGLEDWKQTHGGTARISTEGGLAKISAVGLGMQSHPGVASKAFSVLSGAGIDIHMISTSEIKISCVIPGSDADRAANLLHQAFLEA